MKRVLVVLMALMLLASADMWAQRRHRPPVRRHHTMSADGIGLDFSYVHSWYRTTDWASDERVVSEGLDGFRIGLNKDFTLVPHALYFQTGLDYTYLNDAKDKSVASLKIIGDRTEHALSIPLRLKYLVPVSDKIKVGVDAGPSLVCGLSSKLKYRTRLNENSTAFYIYDYHSGKTKVESMPPAVQEWADAQQPGTSLRRLYVQMGAAVAAEFLDVLEAKVGCDFGLVNNYKGQLSDAYKMRQGQFYLAVGLRF